MAGARPAGPILLGGGQRDAEPHRGAVANDVEVEGLALVPGQCPAQVGDTGNLVAVRIEEYGIDGALMQRFISDSSSLDVLFIIDANPSFTSSPSLGLDSILSKIPTVVSIQPFPSEAPLLKQSHQLLP